MAPALPQRCSQSVAGAKRLRCRRQKSVAGPFTAAAASFMPNRVLLIRDQGTRKQKPRLFFETEKQRFLFVFVEAAEGKQEGLWEGSGHSGQGAAGGHAGTRHE